MAKLKQVFLIIIGCAFTALSNPQILTASDHFVAKTPNFQVAETVLSERKNLDQKTAETPKVAETFVLNDYWLDFAAKLSAAQQSKTPIQEYSITVNLPTRKDYLAVSSVPSYSDIYRFGKMVFAHNSADLFGSLANLSVGETVRLTEGETSKNYTVSDVAYYPKTEQGLNNDPYMINKISSDAFGHDAALMTCAGVMYGNGDASQRLVVYVDAAE